MPRLVGKVSFFDGESGIIDFSRKRKFFVQKQSIRRKEREFIAAGVAVEFFVSKCKGVWKGETYSQAVDVKRAFLNQRQKDDLQARLHSQTKEESCASIS